MRIISPVLDCYVEYMANAIITYFVQYLSIYICYVELIVVDEAAS